MTRKPLNSILVKPAGPDCNLACSYCFYTCKSGLFPETKIHRMSEETLTEMIRQLMHQTGEQAGLGWQGGESTLMGLQFFEKAVDLMGRFGRNQSIGNGRMNEMLNSERQNAFGAVKKNLPTECLECLWLTYCAGGCPRQRPAADTRPDYLCKAYSHFFEHADARMKDLAAAWKAANTSKS